MPPTDRGGVLPEPLAPRVFQEVYRAGKNPDGKYWKEFDGRGERFNLFERTCERVPASREWLLKDYLPYLKEDPPAISHSRAYLKHFLNSCGLIFIPSQAVCAIKYLRPKLYQYLRDHATVDLVDAATPSTTLFLIAYLHDVTWRSKTRCDESHVRRAEDAVIRLCESLIERGFDDASEIAAVIRGPLMDAVCSIRSWGDRSPVPRFVAELDDRPQIPVVAKESQELRDACACLHAAGEQWYERTIVPLPPRYTSKPDAPWAPTDESVEHAIRTVMRGVIAAHGDIRKSFVRSLLSMGQPSALAAHVAMNSSELHQPPTPYAKRTKGGRRRASAQVGPFG